MSRGRPSLILRLVAAQAGILIAAVSLPWIVMVVVPGVLAPTGKVLCPDDTPEVFVVEYTETTSDGTGTNFTIVCMDEAGEVDEVGSWAPLGVYLLGFWVALQVIVLPFVILGWLRALRRSRRGPRFDPPPFAPPGGWA